MIGRLNELLQTTRRAVLKSAKKVVKSFIYPPDSKEECDNYKELLEYNLAVTKLRDQSLTKSGICICTEEVDKIEAAIHRLYPECKTGTLDYTKSKRPDAEQWVLDNPLCVAYETAADYIEAACKRVGINFSVVEKKCAEVGVDIKITDHVVCKALEIAFKIEKQECPTDIDVTLNLQECITDFQISVEPVTCDLDFETYLTEISCGADIETIITKYECTADVDVEVGEPLCGISVSPSVSPSASNSPSPSASPSPSSEITPTFTISVEDSTICYYTDVDLEAIPDEVIPGVTYEWDFGSGAVPPTGTGAGPHTVYYTTSGVKTITCIATNGDLTHEETTNITVSTCAGSIVGSIKNELGVGVAGPTVRLFNDANLDGISDGGAAVRTVTANASGTYVMASLTPGSYVIVLTMPAGFSSVLSSQDDSPDGDLAPNNSNSDLIIPVTITPSKVDLDNNFVLQTA